MEIRLLETAKEDLREAWKFYEKNAAGLGDYFLDCIQADVRSLNLYTGIHEMSEGFHRMLAKRFPFAVYYLIENETIDIYAILDCRRDVQTCFVSQLRRKESDFIGIRRETLACRSRWSNGWRLRSHACRKDAPAASEKKTSTISSSTSQSVGYTVREDTSDNFTYI